MRYFIFSGSIGTPKIYFFQNRKAYWQFIVIFFVIFVSPLLAAIFFTAAFPEDARLWLAVGTITAATAEIFLDKFSNLFFQNIFKRINYNFNARIKLLVKIRICLVICFALNIFLYFIELVKPYVFELLFAFAIAGHLIVKSLMEKSLPSLTSLERKKID